MAQHTLSTEHHDEGHHIVPVKDYLRVFAFLMVFLLLTVGAAYLDLSKYVPIPGLNIFVMLGIALVKASAVIWVFMNVRAGTKLTWLYAGMGFVWFITMFVIFMDYLTRHWNAGGWQ